MLSKNRLKLIRSLAGRKARQGKKLFIVEGDTIVREMLRPVEGFPIHSLYATRQWIDRNQETLSGEYEVVEVDPGQLKKISGQSAPNKVFAVVHLPVTDPGGLHTDPDIILGLYQLRDPGNLGTILRVADWFGIRHVVCSPDSVDLYNPKVIQSSMGSFLRVKVHYLELEDLIRESKATRKFNVYATGMKGRDLYEMPLDAPGMILLGNESRGLTSSLAGLADSTVGIPSHDSDSHPESLNVAVSAAILCAEFRRRGRPTQS